MDVSEQLPVSRAWVQLSRHHLRQMLRLVRLTYSLSQRPVYRSMVFPELPEVARFDPGHAGLMMGYDFHLTAEGPRLIEVNTNAGGGYLSWQAFARAEKLDPAVLPERLLRRLVDSFQQEWIGFARGQRPLEHVVILDDEPEKQALYPEMCAFRDGLRKLGLAAEIVHPGQLDAGPSGVFFQDRPVDLVYNRHCDFFLEENALAGIRAAYLQGQVCLSPNPFVYGLLADKRRMILWTDASRLQQLDLQQPEIELLLKLVPLSRLLADCDTDAIWQERKQLVFKPVTRFGSRGVLMGKGISRKRFSQQDPTTTLVQRVAPAGITEAGGQAFKTDLRLYAYRNRLLGIGARLYQGQVTNLSTEGGGFAPVILT